MQVGWSNTRKKIHWSFWKRYPESYKEATRRKTRFSCLSASGLCGLRLWYLELWNLPAQIRGNSWESNQWKEDSTAGSWKEPGSLRHSLWVGQTQSCPLAPLVYDIINCPSYWATHLRVFYSLKPKILHLWQVGSLLIITIIPSIWWAKPAIYNKPGLPSYQPCEVWVTVPIYLHVGMFRPRKSDHRLSGNELWSCAEPHCRDPPPSHSASRRPGQFCDLMCLPSLHALNIHIPSSSSLHILISGVNSLD